MEKTRKIILIPTAERAEYNVYGLFLDKNKDRLYTFMKSKYSNSNDNCVKINLFVLSDDEIKEGDWFILTENDSDTSAQYEILKCIHKTDTFITYGKYNIPEVSTVKSSYDVIIEKCKKIIATTDLMILHSYWNKNNSFPFFSSSFINYFISEYNKGNKIEEINVEYEQHNPSIQNIICDDGLFILKLNPDNTININKSIKTIKNTWTKQEVEQKLIYCVSELAASFGVAKTAAEMKKWNEATNAWIESNLTNS